MIVYARGDCIPECDRLYRSKVFLKKYWRLSPDGKPDPNCAGFLRRSDIELTHRAYPSLGEYRVITKSVGRPPTGFDRKEYDRLRNLNRKRS